MVNETIPVAAVYTDPPSRVALDAAQDSGRPEQGRTGRVDVVFGVEAP